MFYMSVILIIICSFWLWKRHDTKNRIKFDCYYSNLSLEECLKKYNISASTITKVWIKTFEKKLLTSLLASTLVKTREREKIDKYKEDFKTLYDSDMLDINKPYVYQMLLNLTSSTYKYIEACNLIDNYYSKNIWKEYDFSKFDKVTDDEIQQVWDALLNLLHTNEDV